MQRRTFKAIIADHDFFVEEQKTYAWNSAIKATEAMLRAYARAHGCIYTGDKPQVTEANDTAGKIYNRVWTTPNGATIEAFVTEVI